MIRGKVIEPRVFTDKPVVNYRKLEGLNQSMLKVFDEDPIKFFEEFKMGRKRKSKGSVAMIIGDLADFFILECRGDEQTFENRFDEKFAMYNRVKGSGQVFLLADYLFEETEACTDPDGTVNCSFMERFRVAYNRVKAEDKYKGDKNTIEKVLEDFEAKGSEYFQLRIDSVDKTVVDMGLVDKAKTVANGLLRDEFTKRIFGGTSDIEYHTHFPIEWKYMVREGEVISCKAEVDMLFIDHEKKEIRPFDLKTTFDNENLDYSYIKNSYYLQASFYWLAVRYWADNEGLKDYIVKPMKFIVGDTSSNNRRPLVYETSEEDLQAGLNGFILRGQKYRGVNELIQNIVWAEENDEWRVSREAFENNGRMKLKINYDGQE